jgi:hypothetical protein
MVVAIDSAVKTRMSTKAPAPSRSSSMPMVAPRLLQGFCPGHENPSYTSVGTFHDLKGIWFNTIMGSPFGGSSSPWLKRIAREVLGDPRDISRWKSRWGSVTHGPGSDLHLFQIP